MFRTGRPDHSKYIWSGKGDTKKAKLSNAPFLSSLSPGAISVEAGGSTASGDDDDVEGNITLAAGSPGGMGGHVAVAAGAG